MSIDLDTIHAELPALPETIRMVVSDMDGTLLTPEKTIAPSTMAMAKELQKRGIPLCLASARPPAAMTKYISQLGLSGQNAGFNGGIIFSPDGTPTVSRLFTRFRSRSGNNFAEKILSAQRFGFGGHVEQK